MSAWRDRRDARTLERLSRARPEVFPEAVWRHALARPLVPVTPTRAVESYWRTHPLRADRLARALAARNGGPANWRWHGDEDRAGPGGFRAPPAPYRDPAFRRGAGFCCVCGEPVFRFGWHADLWEAGPNRRAQWHLGCVQAWKFWNAPSDQVALLKRRQGHRCLQTGGRLKRDAEVDHRTPLYQVWRDHRDTPWPSLLAFWGAPSLQVINRPAHVANCAAEARDRGATRRGPPGSSPKASSPG